MCRASLISAQQRTLRHSQLCFWPATKQAPSQATTSLWTAPSACVLQVRGSDFHSLHKVGLCICTGMVARYRASVGQNVGCGVGRHDPGSFWSDAGRNICQQRAQEVISTHATLLPDRCGSIDAVVMLFHMRVDFLTQLPFLPCEHMQDYA